MTTSPAPALAPRQLDIIVDTALAVDFKNVTDLSTAHARKNVVDLSTARSAGNVTDLSTAMKAIERARKERKISVQRLCAIAGIHPNTYWNARKGVAPMRHRTMERLQAAMSGKSRPAAHSRTVVQSYLRRLIRDFARQQGLDPEAVVNQDFSSECTNDPTWLLGSQLRRYAMYVLVEGLLDGQRAPIAGAAGISRQGVHKAVAAIEQKRMSDDAFDQWMQREIDNVRADR
ncbi:hypothetical protein JQ599_09630 [Bradyrhizobium diazoefficiens]|nr:hypothetical protein [Bradyrhizobium diazoefficiens]MBR0700159.1 hypothetical protein [Bradyrhizobium diazoefficiens]MBR0768494.1 hypothetical protein [Bradyrhizobium diazoefficiens]